MEHAKDQQLLQEPSHLAPELCDPNWGEEQRTKDIQWVIRQGWSGHLEIQKVLLQVSGRAETKGAVGQEENKIYPKESKGDPAAGRGIEAEDNVGVAAEEGKDWAEGAADADVQEPKREQEQHAEGIK